MTLLLAADSGRPGIAPTAPAPEPKEHPPTEPPEERNRLAEVSAQLSQVEILLRETDSPEQAGLADRIAELERAVGRLLAARER